MYIKYKYGWYHSWNSFDKYYASTAGAEWNVRCVQQYDKPCVASLFLPLYWLAFIFIITVCGNQNKKNIRKKKLLKYSATHFAKQNRKDKQTDATREYLRTCIDMQITEKKRKNSARAHTMAVKNWLSNLSVSDNAYISYEPFRWAITSADQLTHSAARFSLLIIPKMGR